VTVQMPTDERQTVAEATTRTRSDDSRALQEIRDELGAQRRESRRVYNAFIFVATAALIIALANLVAIALDGTSSNTASISAPAATAGAPPAAAPAHASAITLSEFNVAPKPSRVANGRVTFNVSNAGRVEHEFVVLKTSKPASDLLKNGRADETGNVGEIGSVKPGQTKTLKLNLAAGHYALLCNLPGHYTAGQYADLTVK
jgi:uncharacterized cupredoxin-like copper-binding protein